MPCTNTKTPTGALGDAGVGQPARGGPAWAPPASRGRMGEGSPCQPGQDGRGEGTVNESARCARYNKGLAAPGGKGLGAALRLVSQRSSSRRRPPGAPSLHVSVWLTGVSICSQTLLPRRRPRLLPGGTEGGFVRLPGHPCPSPWAAPDLW